MSVEEEDEYYYRIIQVRDSNALKVCRLRWLDEDDYDQDRFLTDKDDYQYKFDTEEQAKEWLNKNIKPEYVHLDSKILNSELNKRMLFKNYED